MDLGEIGPLRASVGMRFFGVLTGFGGYLCVTYAVTAAKLAPGNPFPAQRLMAASFHKDTII
ncbi:hypothetical protein MKMG_01051 [Methanogenium sp. MK-MG]|nr:hypothetical protein MKMG_01051 [Methanogenium sp. MK-MG]